MNILKITPRQKHITELVDSVQKLIDMLNSGECVGFVAIGIGNDGGTHLFQCAPDVPLITSIGASALLHRHLLNCADEIRQS